MDYCYVSDVGVAHIVCMTTLTELILSKTKLTDAGMRSVAGAQYNTRCSGSVVCVHVCVRVCVRVCTVCVCMSDECHVWEGVYVLYV